MGAFWDLIQVELDRERFDVSDRKLALRLGVSPSTIGNWRLGLKQLPDRRNLRAVADFTGQAYEDVLMAALSETGHAEGTRLERAARRGKSTGRDLRRQQDEQGQAPDPEGPEGGA